MTSAPESVFQQRSSGCTSTWCMSRPSYQATTGTCDRFVALIPKSSNKKASRGLAGSKLQPGRHVGCDHS
eukprot:s4894_g2.t1